jgi:fido (protein-threonine AMPylation protein)
LFKTIIENTFTYNFGTVKKKRLSIKNINGTVNIVFGTVKIYNNRSRKENGMEDFKEYELNSELSRREKVKIWEAAIGLQEVDGLKTSEYLINNAKENIEGKLTFSDIRKRLESYYEEMPIDVVDRTEEADKVSACIAEILSDKSFYFSPLELKRIHKSLFSGMYDFAGEYRTVNITKKEWVLNEETVLYSSYDTIEDALRYDFNNEENFNFRNLTPVEIVRHIQKFISDIWQIHPFREGNTRTIAVFAIKYLRTFGFELDNSPFSEHSWFFRNALVRANYKDYKKGVYETQEYLDLFFDNLIFGKKNRLENKYLNIDLAIEMDNTINLSTEEKIKALIKRNPEITLDIIAGILKIGLRTVKRYIKTLKEKKMMKRHGSDKKGHWEVL